MRREWTLEQIEEWLEQAESVADELDRIDDTLKGIEPYRPPEYEIWISGNTRGADEPS